MIEQEKLISHLRSVLPEVPANSAQCAYDKAIAFKYILAES